MAAGRRRHRLTIYRAALVDDGFSRVPGWATLATVSAARVFVSDGERLRAQQQGAAITARFTILRLGAVTDVSAADECECAGQRFGISNVKPVGDLERELEITAHALSNGTAA